MKYLTKFLMATALAVFSINASAIPFTTVGTKDTKIAQTTLGSSGDAAEETWIESVLGFDVAYTKVANSGGSLWEAVTGTGSSAGDYAFDFGSGVDPVYFMVKTGGGGGTNVDNTHFLYENIASLQWAFINLADFGSGVSLTNITVISHAATANNTDVAAPGPLVVMAIGLVGMLGMRGVKKLI